MKVRGFKVVAKYQDTVRGFPYDNKDDMYHNKFNITVMRDRVRRSFIFYDSAKNCQLGIDTLDKDALKHALYCFLSDARSGEQDFEEFCSEFGCDPDSRSAHRTWRACRKSSDKVARFGLSEDELIHHLNALVS